MCGTAQKFCGGPICLFWARGQLAQVQTPSKLLWGVGGRNPARPRREHPLTCLPAAWCFTAVAVACGQGGPLPPSRAHCVGRLLDRSGVSEVATAAGTRPPSCDSAAERWMPQQVARGSAASPLTGGSCNLFANVPSVFQYSVSPPGNPPLFPPQHPKLPWTCLC